MGTSNRSTDPVRTAQARQDRLVSLLVDGQPWTEVTSLDETGPDDQAFLIDVTTGAVVFGDGRHGRRPPAGATITATYRAGNGEVTEQFAGVKRPQFYNGQRLTAADFKQEQEYHLRQRRLHNRMFHGAGVVSGLRVTAADTSSPPAIVVEAGLALDPAGREVILTASVELAIREECLPQYVVVEYTARETDWVAVPDDETSKAGSRIEDGSIVRLAADQASEQGVAIARIVRTSLGWTVDSTFEPTRPR